MNEDRITKNNNIRVSSIGLGCVTFGREIDAKASFEIMDYALTHGVTLFDTATIYGSGASETIIGEWLASRRPASDNIIVATKILPPFDPESIEKSVHQSLRRLGVNMIDILYLHRWDASFETDASLDAFEKLIQQGKLKRLGASNFTTQQLLHTLHRQTTKGLVNFQFVQNNHNLAVSEIDDKLIQACVANKISLVTYSPLGAGFLTGKHQHGVQSGSRFEVIPGHQDIYFNENAHRRLVKLLDVAARTGYTPAHLALAWALHQPHIDSVLVGGRSTKHVEQAFSALAFNDPEIFAELESA